eukprot:6191170-Pleurochrysis_carterae.AAC.1
MDSASAHRIRSRTSYTRMDPDCRLNTSSDERLRTAGHLELLPVEGVVGGGEDLLLAQVVRRGPKIRLQSDHTLEQPRLGIRDRALGKLLRTDPRNRRAERGVSSNPRVGRNTAGMRRRAPHVAACGATRSLLSAWSHRTLRRFVALDESPHCIQGFRETQLSGARRGAVRRRVSRGCNVPVLDALSEKGPTRQQLVHEEPRRPRVELRPHHNRLVRAPLGDARRQLRRAVATRVRRRRRHAHALRRPEVDQLERAAANAGEAHEVLRLDVAVHPPSLRTRAAEVTSSKKSNGQRGLARRHWCGNAAPFPELLLAKQKTTLPTVLDCLEQAAEPPRPHASSLSPSLQQRNNVRANRFTCARGVTPGARAPARRARPARARAWCAGSRGRRRRSERCACATARGLGENARDSERRGRVAGRESGEGVGDRTWSKTAEGGSGSERAREAKVGGRDEQGKRDVKQCMRPSASSPSDFGLACALYAHTSATPDAAACTGVRVRVRVRRAALRAPAHAREAAVFALLSSLEHEHGAAPPCELEGVDECRRVRGADVLEGRNLVGGALFVVDQLEEDLRAALPPVACAAARARALAELDRAGAVAREPLLVTTV